jgi:putative transcriptional regulator
MIAQPPELVSETCGCRQYAFSRHNLPDVKKLRERLGLTQAAFAAAYRIPIGTLRDWELRRKLPDATARAYLTVIDRDPQAVAKLLVEAA